jgi:hypothetical protein
MGPGERHCHVRRGTRNVSIITGLSHVTFFRTPQFSMNYTSNSTNGTTMSSNLLMWPSGGPGRGNCHTSRGRGQWHGVHSIRRGSYVGSWRILASTQAVPGFPDAPLRTQVGRGRPSAPFMGRRQPGPLCHGSLQVPSLAFLNTPTSNNGLARPLCKSSCQYV